MEENKEESQESATPQANPEVQALQEQINKLQEMLLATADAGRLSQFEQRKAGKQPMKVKLSIYKDKLIIGWRTIKDIAVFHPTTGKQIGEEQEYEVILLDNEGQTSKEIINGYPQFTGARYDKRVEAEVIGRREDSQGNLAYDVKLDDGRMLTLAAQFVN